MSEEAAQGGEIGDGRANRSIPGLPPIEKVLGEAESHLRALQGRRARPVYQELAAVFLGISSAIQLAQTLSGLAEGDPLRSRLGDAVRRAGEAHRAFYALVERGPAPHRAPAGDGQYGVQTVRASSADTVPRRRQRRPIGRLQIRLLAA